MAQVWKKIVTVHQTLRLCGQTVHIGCEGWQRFLPMRNCFSLMLFLSQTACHRDWSPLPNLLPSLLPKLPNLMPNPQPSVLPNLLPRLQPSASEPAAGEPIPMAPVEHVQLFKVKYSRQKKWPTACLSVELNAHPNRQFPDHFVDHGRSCLHVLRRLTGPLFSYGAQGTVTLAVFHHSPGGLVILSHAAWD